MVTKLDARLPAVEHQNAAWLNEKLKLDVSTEAIREATAK